MKKIPNKTRIPNLNRTFAAVFKISLQKYITLEENKNNINQLKQLQWQI
jgi:hypothetical protein